MPLRRVVALAITVLVSTSSCNAPDAEERAVTSPPMDVAQFKPVGDFLVRRCGSLDCHGQVERNFRIYGRDGLRSSPNAVPGDLATPSTDDEYRGTLTSLTSLEPSVFAEVIASHGASPERLIFLRKATGLEGHKAGQLVVAVPPDDQYTCITSWLAGQVNTEACKKALDPNLYP